MNDYPDQFTGWKPGAMVFYVDSTDVDTVKRLSNHTRVPDLREPKKKIAAACSDRWLAVTLRL
jgi:hypothetical protein